jgi:hypothetical protein
MFVNELDTILQTTFKKEVLINRLIQHPDEVESAIQAMLQDKQPLGWRATWILKSILNPNDPRLLKVMDQLLHNLPERPDGHQRELLHLILSCELNDEQEGYLFETCLSIWISIRKSPSVRYLALRHLAKLVKKYPELVHELELVTDQPYLETLSPGIRKGCHSMVTELKLNL